MPRRDRTTLSFLPGAVAGLSMLASTCIQAEADSEYSMRIMDVFSMTGRGIVMTGQIESGTVHIGSAACVPLASGGTAALRVEGIERFRKVLESATVGDLVGILVAGIDDDDVARGELLHGDCTPEPKAEPQPESE